MMLIEIRNLVGIGIVSVATLVSGSRAAAADFYVSQNGSGITNSIAWLNASAHWNSGAGTIQPGDTVHLVGTITNELTVQGSGTSGNPITVLFEPNAKLSAPTWSGSIISLSQQSYVTIDGGSNGMIEATANGTGLVYSNSITGVNSWMGSGIIIKNLTVQNLYVNVAGPDHNGDTTACNGVIIYGGTNIVVSNCTFHDECHGLMIVYIEGTSNLVMTHCTAYHCNWGGAAGDANGTATLTGLMVDHCHFYAWSNWDDTGDINHHNGFFSFANTGWISNAVFTANYVGPGYGSHNTSGIYVSGNVFNPLFYNNVFDASDGTYPADGQLYFLSNVATTNLIFNNTFVGATAINFTDGLTSGSNYLVCLNNAFYNNYMAIGSWWAGQTITISDTNNFYGNPVFTATLTGSLWGPFTFVQWQYDLTNAPMGFDLHSTTNNSNFNAYYVPQSGSALIGAGANLSSYFTTDYAGNPRAATGNWTIGAYEMSNLPQVTLKASPMIITNGQSSSILITNGQSSSILTWWVANATNVILSGFGQVLSTGSTNVYPDTSTNYTITATGTNGTALANVKIKVFSQQLQPPADVHVQQ